MISNSQRALRKISSLVILLAIAVMPLGCISAPSAVERIVAGLAPSWGDVNDWLYQLQNLDLNAVGNSKYDLVVMDYSSDGTAAGEYTPAEIAALRNSPGGPKLVLAYMSIGEAEDYRYYWQSDWKSGNPIWLDAENLDWPGNYKVKYWYPEWQSIIFGYLDKIIAAGFDGVYLDLIDAYEYYAKTRPTAEQEMVDFVVAISDYAHVSKNKAKFGIFPQNAAEVEAHPGYLAAVTGIGQEETYYGYDGVDNEPTPPEVTSEIEGHLDKFVAAGKLALTVDYTTQQEQIDDAYQRAKDKGYIPFCTVRDLDQLTINPGHEPESFTLWAEGSTQKILRDDPVPAQTWVWDGKQVTIKAAGNEHEPFQLVVTADKGPLEDVSVQISDLSDGLGNTIGQGNISLALEHYTTVTIPSNAYGQTGTFPDALPPLTTFNLSQGQNQPLWAKVFVPKDTVAGEYTGQITVTSARGTAALPLKLIVWDFALPDENHLDAGYVPGNGDLGAQYGVEDAWEGSPAWNAIYQKECDFLLANRLAPIVELPEYPVYSEDKAGLVQVDFGESDALYHTLYDSGKVRSFMLPLPVDAEGTEWPMQEEGQPFVFDQAFHDKMVRYFSLLYDHYQAKSWMDRDRFYGYAYIQDDLFWVSDEPFHWGKLGYDRVRLWANWVYEANPNLIFAVYGESTVPWGDDWGDLRPYVDQWGIYPQYMALVPDAIQGEIANHKIISFELNSFADNIDYPATYHRLMSWFAYKYGAQGMDLWAVDYWFDENVEPINPWVDNPHNLWGNGAGAILYPGPPIGVDGPVSSIRLELNREMVEDYEYLYLLEQLGGKDYAQQVVLDLVPRDDIYGLALTPKDYYQAREAVAEEILKLKAGASDLVIAQGTVVDENGAPLSDVLVSTGINAALTDGEGVYRLYIHQVTQPVVTFSKADYQTTSATVKEGENAVVTLTKIPTEETILFSFEEGTGEWEIDGLGPVTITQSSEHATAGGSSLKVAWGDVEWTYIYIELPLTDWQGQSRFEFDVYNPHVSVTTFDLGLWGGADKYYEESIAIGPERAKKVRIPITKIAQELDLNQIIELELAADNIMIWDWSELGEPPGEVVVRAGEKTLYFDNFRLVKVAPVAWDPWSCDEDASGYIEIGELLQAINDYIGGDVTISQLLEIINLYISHTPKS